MTEWSRSDFDDQTDQRPPDADTEAPPSTPVPLRPSSHHYSSPPPPVTHDQWPPAGPHPDPGQVPSDAVPPAPPGAVRSPTDSETTAIVDRDWMAALIDRDHAGQSELTEPYGATRHSLDDEAAPPGASGGRADAGQSRLSSRQQPPPGSWVPPSPREPVGQADWSAAQGSATSWNYVDTIRRSELVPTRRIPPQRGWRKILYYSTFKLINPGQSPDERYEAERVAKVRTLLRGTYKIGVLGKGGVGKSTVAAGVGSLFAELRLDDRVVAVDADTAFGKLAARIDPTVSGSYWEVAADRDLHTFADMRARVGSNAAGLFVLGGAQETARRRVLDPDIYRRATAQLDRHFTVSIIDCGSTMDSPVTREVLTDVDALIVVSSPWYDGASAAGQTLEWLANGGYTALLHRTVVVVNDSDGHADHKDMKLLVERFGRHGQKVIQLPFDRQLRPGGVIDVKNEISPLSRRRLLELAAECAEHFAATSDRPRRAAVPGQPANAGVGPARGDR
jgi:MinD-like ATPase involved in chromosome partitioning or flagellar assembly